MKPHPNPSFPTSESKHTSSILLLLSTVESTSKKVTPPLMMDLLSKVLKISDIFQATQEVTLQ